mmetsp:Transcript_10166/g.28992  ORF Transcript_10166/g.28992 Transcript_10166/m.28992 type:complete len:549 (-) Transcript_10166:120-1766(-)
MSMQSPVHRLNGRSATHVATGTARTEDAITARSGDHTGEERPDAAADAASASPFRSQRLPPASTPSCCLPLIRCAYGHQHRIDGRSPTLVESSDASDSDSTSNPLHAMYNKQFEDGVPHAAAYRQQMSLQITDGERLLAKELQAMSLDQREKIYEAIHGVNEVIEETGPFVEQKLKELEQQIVTIHKKEAYSKAAFMSPYAVRDRELRLKVLRATQWHPREAAKLLVKYFETKTKIFGEQQALRPIAYESLPKDAIASLEAGAIIRHVDCIDLAGRSILIFNYAKFFFQSGLSMAKALWYMNANSPQQGTSKGQNGLVLVLNTVGTTASECLEKFNQSKSIKELGISDSMPVKLTSVHLCFESSSMRPLVNIILLTMPQNMRIRTKVHYGSHMEILYGLGAYGIPSKLLPMGMDGNPNHGLISANLSRTRAFELQQQQKCRDALPAPDCIHAPTHNDIVLGRGRGSQNFAGNIELNKFLAKECKRKYESMRSRKEKTAFSTHLVQEIKARGGVRFLQRDEETGMFWREVSDEIARQKIAMALRNLSRK